MFTKRLKQVRCEKENNLEWQREVSAMYSVTKDTHHKSVFSLAWYSGLVSKRVVQKTK